MSKLFSMFSMGAGSSGSSNKTMLGVNIASVPVYGTDPGPVNLAYGSLNGSQIYLVEKQDGTSVTLDANGNPQSDFTLFHRRGPLVAPYTITCQFKGKVASLSWRLQRGASNLSTVTYDAGTNTSTFTFTYDPTTNTSDGGAGINFNGTQQTDASAVGTGVSDIWMWSPAYVGNKSQYWSDEAAQQYADFAYVRTMDLQYINNDRWTTDWDPAKELSVRQDSVKSCVAFANQFGKDLWMQIPVNATADWDNNFFTYVDANLAVGRKLYFGFSNETWNPGFYAFSRCLVLAATEVKGAAGSLTGRKIVSVVGDGTTTTVTVDYTVDLAVGEVIACTKMNGGSDATIASVSTNSFTYASSYSGTLSIDSSYWFVSKSSGSNLATGGNYNIYGNAANFAIRRLVQAADRCRAIVGDAKMMTRFLPIDEHQGIHNDGSGRLQFIAALAGSDAAVKTKIYALGGAPYFYLDVDGNALASDPANHTVADYVSYYATSIPESKKQFNFAQRFVQAQKYGVKVAFYEGGAEETGINSNSQNNFNKNEAKLTPEFGALYKQYLIDMATCGVAMFTHYNGSAWTNTGQQYCYGYTDSYFHVTPYWQAFKDYNAMETVPVLNPISTGTTVLDARLRAGYFPPASGTYPSIGNNNGQRVTYIVNTDLAGTWSVVMNAAANSPTTYTVWVNNAQQISTKNMQVSNSYPDLLVFNDAAPWSLTLNKGTNIVEIVCGEAHGPIDQAIKSLTFTKQ